jgi:metal-responsive CopG/Arc/MetJ family transcriptional regulator
MRATVTIPDELLAELLTIVGTTNRTRAINEAIRGYVRQANIKRLIALRGTVDIADNDEIESWDEAEYRGG